MTSTLVCSPGLSSHARPPLPAQALDRMPSDKGHLDPEKDDPTRQTSSLLRRRHTGSSLGGEAVTHDSRPSWGDPMNHMGLWGESCLKRLSGEKQRPTTSSASVAGQSIWPYPT